MSKFTLPNGVIVSGKHYNMVTIDELRGKHQNMLVNPSPKTPIDFVLPILSDLVLDITDSGEESVLKETDKKTLILHKLSIQDIQFIMAKVREVSYGPEYFMSLTCSHCEAENKARLDLSTLQVFPRKDTLTEDQMKLPKEKLEFRYGHMSLSNLLKMVTEDDSVDFMKHIITATTSFMLSKLGESTKVNPSDLDNLRATDIDYIKDNIPELAFLDTKVEHTCTACEKDFEQELPVLAADFLLRSRT